MTDTNLGIIMRLLGSRDYTEGQLRTKMTKREWPAQEQDRIIEELKKHRYVDDDRFAELFIIAAIRKATIGPQKVIFQLKTRGVDESIIATHIAAQFTKEAEQPIADAVLKKKLANDKMSKKDRPRQYYSQFLFRKGFQSDTIQYALRVLE